MIAFASCENSESITCILPSTVIESNSPVVSGDNLILTTTEASYGASYEWTGPNGFVSSLQNPIISNTTPSMAGEYSLKVKKGVCESEIQTVKVDIIENTVACTPLNNTGYFTDISSTISLYSVSSNYENDKFNFIGANTNTEVRIIFSNSSIPSVGIYSIVPNSTTYNSNEVVVSLKRGDIFGSVTYFARTGSVKFSRDVNNNLYAIFCDLPFYLSTNISPSTNATVKITNN